MSRGPLENLDVRLNDQMTAALRAAQRAVTARRVVCRNPRCRDPLPSAARWQLCPSCRYAWGMGAAIAGFLTTAISVAIRLWW